MKSNKFLTVLGIGISTMALMAPANASSMRQIALTAPPVGHVHFCRALPQECQPVSNVVTKAQLTEERFAQLVYINQRVNSDVQPMTDHELYHVPEHWTFPNGAGDCEDYVLLKRHALIQNGWPASALLITVVLDEKGEGHAVLTVSTDRGDFVLDNTVDDVKHWTKTPYTFLKRQSHHHAGKWVSLDHGDGARGLYVGQNTR